MAGENQQTPSQQQPPPAGNVIDQVTSIAAQPVQQGVEQISLLTDPATAYSHDAINPPQQPQPQPQQPPAQQAPQQQPAEPQQPTYSSPDFLQSLPAHIRDEVYAAQQQQQQPAAQPPQQQPPQQPPASQGQQQPPPATPGVSEQTATRLSELGWDPSYFQNEQHALDTLRVQQDQDQRQLYDDARIGRLTREAHQNGLFEGWDDFQQTRRQQSQGGQLTPPAARPQQQPAPVQPQAGYSPMMAADHFDPSWSAYIVTNEQGQRAVAPNAPPGIPLDAPQREQRWVQNALHAWNQLNDPQGRQQFFEQHFGDVLSQRMTQVEQRATAAALEKVREEQAIAEMRREQQQIFQRAGEEFMWQRKADGSFLTRPGTSEKVLTPQGQQYQQHLEQLINAGFSVADSDEVARIRAQVITASHPQPQFNQPQQFVPQPPQQIGQQWDQNDGSLPGYNWQQPPNPQGQFPQQQPPPGYPQQPPQRQGPQNPQHNIPGYDPTKPPPVRNPQINNALSNQMADTQLRAYESGANMPLGVPPGGSFQGNGAPQAQVNMEPSFGGITDLDALASATMQASGGQGYPAY